jgi:hypothetical protein
LQRQKEQAKKLNAGKVTGGKSSLLFSSLLTKTREPTRRTTSIFYEDVKESGFLGGGRADSIMVESSKMSTVKGPAGNKESVFFSAGGSVKHFDLKNLLSSKGLASLKELVGDFDTTQCCALWELVKELGMNDPIWEQFRKLDFNVTCVESGPFGAGSIKCHVYLSHDDFFCIYKKEGNDGMAFWKDFHASDFEILTQHPDHKEVSIEFSKKNWVFKTKGSLKVKFENDHDFDSFVENWQESKVYYADKK